MSFVSEIAALKHSSEDYQMAILILWVIVVGTIAGIIAMLFSPGPKTPSGFILGVVLGIVGAFAGPFVWTFVAQVSGWYRPNQGAGFIASPIGALFILLIWIAWRTISSQRA